MLKRSLAALAGLLAAASVVAASPAGATALDSASHHRHACTGPAFRWYTGAHSAPDNAAVYRLGDCLSLHFGVAPDQTHCRLEHESHAYAYAHRPGSKFWGAMQIGWDHTAPGEPSTPKSDSEWEELWGAVSRWAWVPTSRPGPFCARCALIAAIFEAKHHGWGRWSTCR